MQVTIRLYRQHDMDLVALYRTEGFSFQKTMKEALRAFASRQDYHIKRPKDAEIKPGYVPKLIQMHIKLDPQKDADSVKALSYIRYGYRSSFLKALFRKCLTSEPLDAYRNRDDLIFDAEKDYITDHHPPKNDTGTKSRSAKNMGKDDNAPKPDSEGIVKAAKHTQDNRGGIQPERKTQTTKPAGDRAKPDTKKGTVIQSDAVKETLYSPDERIDVTPPEDETPDIFSADDDRATGTEPQSTEEPAKKTGSSEDTSTGNGSDDGFGLFSDNEEDTTDDDYADILKAMNSLAH